MANNKYLKNTRLFKIGDCCIWQDIEVQVIDFGSKSWEYVIEVTPNNSVVVSEHELVRC